MKETIIGAILFPFFKLKTGYNGIYYNPRLVMFVIGLIILPFVLIINIVKTVIDTITTDYIKLCTTYKARYIKYSKPLEK